MSAVQLGEVPVELLLARDVVHSTGAYFSRGSPAALAGRRVHALEPVLGGQPTVEHRTQTRRHRRLDALALEGLIEQRHRAERLGYLVDGRLDLLRRQSRSDKRPGPAIAAALGQRRADEVARAR